MSMAFDLLSIRRKSKASRLRFAMAERSAFVLRIRPEKVEEYRAAHAEVWPELLDALRGAGIRNYSIFLDGTSAFGYFEADDLAAAAAYLERQEVSTRW